MHEIVLVSRTKCMRRRRNESRIAVGEPEQFRIYFALTTWRLHDDLHLIGVEHTLNVASLQIEQRLQKSRVANEHRCQPQFAGAFERRGNRLFDIFRFPRLSRESYREFDLSNGHLRRALRGSWALAS